MRTNLRFWGLAVGLLAFFLPVGRLAAQPAPADTSTSGRFGEQMTVSEVLLDVLVTDKQGNVIVGLAPDDFMVEENGKSVDVSGVSFYSNRRLLDAVGGNGTPAAGEAVPAPDHRYFVLFFHEQQHNSASVPEAGLLQRQLEAARESRRWVQKEKLLDDFVAVVSYDVKLKVHQDFTQDASAILTAITNATTGEDPGANWPSRMGMGTSGPSLKANLPAGNELGKQTTTMYGALNTLAAATKNIVGRKNLILFSTGFNDDSVFGLYKPDPRYMPGTIHTLNDSNVAVYAIDLAPDELVYSSTGALYQLANETGGRYYQTFTSFITPLRQLASENNGYYLLSYRATHPAGESGYQKVRVKTRNPEFKVQAREGYEFGS